VRAQKEQEQSQGQDDVKELPSGGKAQSEAEKDFYGEFDPGSGRTLAACLTHASRTGISRELALC